MTKPISYWVLCFILFGVIQLIDLEIVSGHFDQVISDMNFILTLGIMPIWLWFFYEYKNERAFREKWFLLLWIEPIK